MAVLSCPARLRHLSRDDATIRLRQGIGHKEWITANSLKLIVRKIRRIALSNDALESCLVNVFVKSQSAGISFVLNPRHQRVVASARLDLLDDLNRHFDATLLTLMAQPVPKLRHLFKRIIRVVSCDQNIGVEQIKHQASPRA